MRNDIEHRCTNAPHQKVREAIAQAFPVVVDLFRLANEAPHEVLGDYWPVMLDARNVYERELEACQKSFENVEWKSNALARAVKICPVCNSHLVEQNDPTNRKYFAVNARCRACGEEIDSDTLIETALKEHFAVEGHVSAKDGSEPPLYTCHDCGHETYVIWEDENGCVGCGASLDECWRCHLPLTPDNVSAENFNLCGYCDNLMSKDD